jgi:hypothetical protein
MILVEIFSMVIGRPIFCPKVLAWALASLSSTESRMDSAIAPPMTRTSRTDPRITTNLREDLDMEKVLSVTR